MKLSAAESALLSSRERDMLQSKGPWTVKDLVSLIKRVRDLRDKQRQLTQRQKIASARRTGSKAGTSGAENARTALKGRVFDRALKHFEGQLDKLNKESTAAAASLELGGTASKPAKKGARKASKKAVKKAAKKSTKKPATKASAKKSAAKTASKPAAKKAGKATAKKTVAKKAAAKKTSKKAASGTGAKAAKAKSSGKASTAKTATKKSPAKAARKTAKPVRKTVSKKVAARKVAKAAEARKSAAPKGPVQNISDKARLNLPKGPGGHVDSQVSSLPSQNMRAKRAR